MYTLAKDLGVPDIDELIEKIGTTERLRAWQAFYIMQATDSNPDVTEWDDPVQAKRKLDRAATRNLRKS